MYWIPGDMVLAVESIPEENIEKDKVYFINYNEAEFYNTYNQYFKFLLNITAVFNNSRIDVNNTNRSIMKDIMDMPESCEVLCPTYGDVYKCTYSHGNYEKDKFYALNTTQDLMSILYNIEHFTFMLNIEDCIYGKKQH